MAKNPGTKFEEWIESSLKPYFPDASRTKASGAVWNSGDVQAGNLEIEAKDKSTNSVSVSETVLKRTEQAARTTARVPVVATRCNIGTYVTLRWDDFEDMISRLMQLEQELDEFHWNFKNRKIK